MWKDKSQVLLIFEQLFVTNIPEQKYSMLQTSLSYYIWKTEKGEKEIGLKHEMLSQCYEE